MIRNAPALIFFCNCDQFLPCELSLHFSIALAMASHWLFPIYSRRHRWSHQTVWLRAPPRSFVAAPNALHTRQRSQTPPGSRRDFVVVARVLHSAAAGPTASHRDTTAIRKPKRVPRMTKHEFLRSCCCRDVTSASRIRSRPGGCGKKDERVAANCSVALVLFVRPPHAMDIDGDVDGALARAMSCMATNDKETLVRQFQFILGDHHAVSPEACAFFLDMNNWNLQEALGAYYDYGSANWQGMGLPPPEYTARLPSMQFVKDITIGEGESVPPNTRFIKTWRFLNNGAEPWPEDCFISFMEGSQLAERSRHPVPSLQARQMGDVSVEMVSPPEKGIYQSRWQLNTAAGIPFGESIWCIIMVDDMGILDITQQMASAPLGHGPLRSSVNPFALPDPGRHSSTESMNGSLVVETSNSMDGMALDAPLSPDSTCFDSELPNIEPSSSFSSTPLNIARPDEAPQGPPCTPCTPPQ
uniref:N_BRCA1_IG domain-containing protein n=1 Tax=Steinernema glaseri TaxID=37863 RepID=A0A1I8A3I7_9BILA